MLRFGPDDGPVAVVALPFWEEANLVRGLSAAMLRALAARGIGGVLADLPGTGDSLVPTVKMRLGTLRDAYAAAVDATGRRRRYALSIRTGALLDTAAGVAGRWHLSPVTGAEATRAAARLAATSMRASGRVPAARAVAPTEGTMLIAGNLVSAAFLADLPDASPAADRSMPRRVVRLGEAAMPADRHVDAFAPWRRAEAGDDQVLAALLAADVADWIARCGG